MAEHGISDAELETIRAVLAECDDEITQVDLFGSRATGKHRSHSDIDLVIHGAVREAAIDRLRTLFIESNLPVSVDIFSYDGIAYQPLREHVDAVRQRLFTAQDIRGAKDRSMRDRRDSSAIVEFMTASLKPYPNMKDSGVEALGQVPVHWAIRRLAQIGTISKGGGGNKDDEVTAGIPCIRYGDLYTTHDSFIEKSRSFVSKEKARKYTAIKYGDVLFAGSGETIDEIGKSAVNLMRQDACCGGDVILFRPTQQIEARYLGYTLDCRQAAIQKATMGRGITIMHIYGTQMKYLTLPIPPLAEQTAIVRFLDHADQHIQRYIRARKKLIALLAEQKQAIIHQAVTGQIDVRTGKSYPSYKPSGVAWLGSVPRHWELSQLRRVTIDRCDGPFGSDLKSSHYTTAGIRVVRLQNIGHGEFIDADTSFISLDHYATLGDHSIVPEDVLIAGLGDAKHPAGRACVAPEALGNAMVKADCFRFRLNRTRVEPRFVATQLTATASVASATLSRGATRQRTNLENTSARTISIPLLDEQASIMDYLEDRTYRIRAAHDSAKRELILLNEYRARLIGEVVAGRIDVREAASTIDMGGD